MTTTATPVDAIPVLARPEAPVRAAEEVRRFAATLRALGDEDWSRRTVCPDWDVRDVAGHVLGMTRTFSAMLPFVRHMGAAQLARGDAPFIDKLTALQVRLNAHLDRSAVVDELERLAPRNARWRSSRRLMRRITSEESLPDGSTETMQAGYLLDIILTRDTWTHRADVAEATGRPMELTAEHDGRIVADVVRDWAERHGQPFRLELTGPAGGTFVGQGASRAPGETAGVTGGATETLRHDAVTFCRILSGRAPGNGLLRTIVPF